MTFLSMIFMNSDSTTGTKAYIKYTIAKNVNPNPINKSNGPKPAILNIMPSIKASTKVISSFDMFLPIQNINEYLFSCPAINNALSKMNTILNASLQFYKFWRGIHKKIRT